MILVLGATGFLGKAVCNKLKGQGEKYFESSLSLGVDLRDEKQTKDLICDLKPKCIINCAAYVGGIQFGLEQPVRIFQDNIKMTTNLLDAARLAGVSRIVNPISNCAYPAKATYFNEDEFWDGPLHETVMVYGFVRKAFWMASWAYKQQYDMDILNLILSNMYGPGDHFDEKRSHAFGALVKKVVFAKKENLPFIELWGTGKPVREWLHIEDGAEALIRGLTSKSSIDPVNIGVGKGISIYELAQLICEYCQYKGEIRLCPEKPDGALIKTVNGDRGRALLGWTPSTSLTTGVQQTIAWYENSLNSDEKHEIT